MSATLTAHLNVLLRELPAISKMDACDYRRETWCRRKALLLRLIQDLDDRDGDTTPRLVEWTLLSPGDV